MLFLGNIIVTGVWKVLADNTGDPRTIAYAQNLVTLTDWIFTTGGVVLILIGAYGMVWVAGLNPLGPAWLIWGQSLFIASGIIWVAILIPTQIVHARVAARFRRRRSDPGKLLASWKALGDLGDDRHAAASRQSLFHGGQAGLRRGQAVRCRAASAAHRHWQAGGARFPGALPSERWGADICATGRGRPRPPSPAHSCGCQAPKARAPSRYPGRTRSACAWYRALRRPGLLSIYEAPAYLILYWATGAKTRNAPGLDR